MRERNSNLNENYLPNGNKLRSGVATNSIVPPCFLFTVYQHSVVLSAWSIYLIWNRIIWPDQQPTARYKYPPIAPWRRTFFSSQILDYTYASRLQAAFWICIHAYFRHVFNPIGLPAAACLLDTTVCAVVLILDLSSLLHAAKLFIVSLAETNTTVQQMVSHADRCHWFCNTLNFKEIQVSGIKNDRTVDYSLSMSSDSKMETTHGQLNRYVTDVVDFITLQQRASRVLVLAFT